MVVVIHDRVLSSRSWIFFNLVHDSLTEELQRVLNFMTIQLFINLSLVFCFFFSNDEIHLDFSSFLSMLLKRILFSGKTGSSSFDRKLLFVSSFFPYNSIVTFSILFQYSIFLCIWTFVFHIPLLFGLLYLVSNYFIGLHLFCF